MMGCEHIGNIRALEGAEVVAVADPHPQLRACAAAASHGVAQFEHHDDLLAAGLVDAVMVGHPQPQGRGARARGPPTGRPARRSRRAG